MGILEQTSRETTDLHEQESSGGDGFPTPEAIKEAIRIHQALAGAKGGRSRSPAKRAATQANIAKARIKRWPGREAAAMGLLPGGVEQVPQQTNRGTLETVAGDSLELGEGEVK